MIYTKIIYDYFKSFIHFEIDLKDGINVICGKNGTGKTTAGIAPSWVFTGKDMELQDEPYIRNLNHVECESSATILSEIDGKKIKFRKFQVDMRTKKQIEQNAPVRISNRYEINDVPMTAKDFFKTLEGYGIDVDRFLLLTNGDYFLSLKKTDMRKILFSLINDIQDIDVARLIPECAKAAEELEESTMEEIIARNKATAKRCKEQMDALPNQIVGMEKSKVEVDPTLGDKAEALKTEISALTEQMNAIKAKADTKAIDLRIRELRNRKTEMHNEVNADRLAKYREAHQALNDAEGKLTVARRDLNRVEVSGEGINNTYKSAVAFYKKLNEDLSEVKKQKFVGKTVCPTCGQKIPKDQVDEAKANWKKAHDETIRGLEDRIRAVKTQCEGYKSDGANLAKEKSEASKKVESLTKAVSLASQEVAKYETVIIPDCKAIDDEILQLEAEKKKSSEYGAEAYKLTLDIADKKDELQAIIRKQAAEVNNSFIDDRIAEAKASLKEYSQAKADAENILYQIQLISQKKNEMLSDAINSNFTRVRFRLFNVQKNGEIKDDCTPLVLCSDGEYRDMTYSANTAAIVAAKLDICNGLQKFYGQKLPIWLDGAECLDEKNRDALKLDTQLILLCVTEDERLVVK